MSEKCYVNLQKIVLTAKKLIWHARVLNLKHTELYYLSDDLISGLYFGHRLIDREVCLSNLSTATYTAFAITDMSSLVGRHCKDSSLQEAKINPCQMQSKCILASWCSFFYSVCNNVWFKLHCNLLSRIFFLIWCKQHRQIKSEIQTVKRFLCFREARQSILFKYSNQMQGIIFLAVDYLRDWLFFTSLTQAKTFCDCVPCS